VNANPLFSSFYFAYVNGMDVGQFRQFFLAQSGLLSILADVITQNSAVFGEERHHSNTNSKRLHQP
jgi:hypothetical protein